MHPLESALLKLDRAIEHIDHFEAEFRSIVESESHEIGHLMNVKTGEYWMLAPEALALPAYIGTMFGDVIQNLRAALEHLMWAVVVQNCGGVDPPKPRNIAFPISDQPRHFNQRPVLWFLTPEHRAILQSHQPYLRRGEKRHSTLSWLRDISDEDKHRAIRLLANALSPDDEPVVDEPSFHNCGELIQPYYTTSGGALYPGAPLAYFRFTWLTPKSRVDMEIHQITLEPVVIEAGERMRMIFPLVDQIAWTIRKAIRDFEPFFEPLPIERKTLTKRLRSKRCASTEKDRV